MTSAPRICEGPDCDVELPPARRAGSRFCSVRCQRRARNARLARLSEKKCSVCGLVKPIDEFYAPYQSECKQCNLARQRAAYKEGRPGMSRDVSYDKNLRRRYGITLAEYKAMVEAQDGCCAICGERSEARMHVDHDHVTGMIRQLLCPPCNAALGGARDSPELLRAMAAYLERHQVAAEAS